MRAKAQCKHNARRVAHQKFFVIFFEWGEGGREGGLSKIIKNHSLLFKIKAQQQTPQTKCNYIVLYCLFF